MNSQPEHGGEPGGYRIVTMASSAGGLQALSRVIGQLPEDFPAPVLIVQHLDRRHDTALAEILARRSELKVKLAEHGELVFPSFVYIAPPNRHLLVEPDGRLALTATELVHFVRPSADLLFESVAGSYGARAIACILTGTGSDGATGLSAVKDRGGTTIVQDPAEADFKGMPEAAIAASAVDFVLGLDGIVSVIIDLVGARRN